MPRATLVDLMNTEGRAELIGGRIIPLPFLGFAPALVTGNILKQVDDYAEAVGRGYAFGSKLAYAIPELPSGRESFSPDVSYSTAPPPANDMDFPEYSPDFAAEVRKQADDGPEAELCRAAKRADYFEAGTLVVWDVDPLARTITIFRAAAPTSPDVRAAGAEADAEPALPGWRVAVDWVFQT